MTKIQDTMVEQQKQHDSILAQKNEELASQFRQKTQDQEELLQAKSNELEDANKGIATFKAYHIDDSARAEGFKDIKWSNRNLRDLLRCALYKGFADRGIIPQKQLTRLELPHADPYYADLPKPFPKPCEESDEGEKTKCDACGETYLKLDYHNHGPACLLFFASYTIRCPCCNGIFHHNDKYQAHEKYCKKYTTPGPTPETIKEMPCVRTHDVLAGSDLEIPKMPSPQHVMSLKASVLDLKSAETLYRAVLPYKDADYANCQLPFPNEQKAILPNGWPHGVPNNNAFAGRKRCHWCREWYLGPALHAHLEACKIFFQGDSTCNSPPHARCEHCGDYYVDNKAYHDHKTICSANSTAGQCTFCGDVFTNEPIKFPGGTETALLGRLTEHTKYCHLNPSRHHIPEWMKRGLDAPLPPTEEPSSTTTAATTTTIATTSRAPPPSTHPVRTPNPPRIATNGYQQPSPQPRSPFIPSPSSGPLLPTVTPLLATASPFRPPRTGSNSPSPSIRPSSHRGASFQSHSSSQGGSPSRPQQQQGGGLSGSRHASQAGSPTLPQQQIPDVSSSPHPSRASSPSQPSQQTDPGNSSPSSHQSTPSPSPSKPKQGDGAT